MSLLMDALNKAEQSKRQGQAAEADAGAVSTEPSAALKLELSPLMIEDAPAPPAPEQATTTPPALPELPAHLGVLDEEFMAHAATTKPVAREKPTARPASPPPEPPMAIAPVAPARTAAPTSTKAATVTAQTADGQDRQAAQNLFDAKQPRAPFLTKKLRWVALGLLTLVVAAAIGVYFWLQLQPSGGLGLAKPIANMPRPPLQAAPPVPAVVPAPVAAAPVAAPTQPPAPRPASAAAPAKEESGGPIRISTAKVTLNPSLTSGYEAYLAGNFDLARSEYLQVLKGEPSNSDALHGMAAISLRQGQQAAAEEFYLRAIEADPKDALAKAGLIGLRGQLDPLQAETRLNALLATQPELPSINFALGSLYAGQNRWNEAQAAFFKAYRGEPDNPDTLFNLAVSLDQLHQAKLALQFYNQALSAAATRPSSFDKAQVKARLRELLP